MSVNITIAALTFAVLLLFAPAFIARAAGEVDPAFSPAAYGGLTEQGSVNVIKLQPDGKILIGGQFTEVHGFSASGLARLNADGTVDTTFNPPDFYSLTQGSSPIFGGNIFAIALQPDGKILVGGDIQGAGTDARRGVRRLNPDGSVDATFFIPPQNFTRPMVHDIKLLADGKILIGGSFNFSGFSSTNLARLNADGTSDNTFVVSGAPVIRDLEIQPDGKIVAGGSNGSTTSPLPRVYRYNSDGTADSSFTATDAGAGGIETVELQADGKIVVAGSYVVLGAATQGRVSRLNTNGTIDASFNPGGAGADGVVNDLAIRPDGKIVIGGGFSSFNGTPIQRIARLNTDGTLDGAFANSGTITNTSVSDIELYPDNRILAGVGTSSLIDPMLRFSADGVFDPSFVVKTSRGGLVNKILQQPDGKVLVAGEFRWANGQERRSIARFNADGTLDTSFVPYFNSLSFIPLVYGMALQPDGKIVVGTWHGVVLQRLNADGSQDMSFNAGMPSSSQVYDVAVQSDGKVIAVGNMMGFALLRLARFNTDGTRDVAFNPPQPGGIVFSVHLQTDGKILVGGIFSQISDIANRNGIARYTTSGGLDGTFVPPGGTNAVVRDIDVQPDGKILQVGAGAPRRLNTDGTLDVASPAAVNSEAIAVRVQPDGTILVGGGFSLVGTTPRNGLALFNSNLTLNTSFTTFPNRAVNDIHLQPDGKVLIAGLFTKVNGLARTRIARLLNATATQPTQFDYDGDRKADISVFRASENRWYIFRSSDSGVTQTVFAIAGDIPVPADYDGDNKTDVGIYRPSSGAWWYLSSINGAQINVNWGGEAGDVPRPGDFDGDGKADFIIFRPTNNFWYRISSGNGAVSNILFGAAGDKPVLGDFDGDGSVDPAIFRPSTGDWWYRSSLTHNQLAVRWGISTDIPAPADFDGDGRTDFAVYRPSTGVWYVINSSNGSFLIGPFGTPEDKPVPADYDGDGKAELAVFRPSTGIWYQLRTNGGFFAMQFGVSTDTPTPNAFVP